MLKPFLISSQVIARANLVSLFIFAVRARDFFATMDHGTLQWLSSHALTISDRPCAVCELCNSALVLETPGTLAVNVLAILFSMQLPGWAAIST